MRKYDHIYTSLNNKMCRNVLQFSSCINNILSILIIKFLKI